MVVQVCRLPRGFLQIAVGGSLLQVPIHGEDFITLEDLNLPPTLAQLCQGVPVSQYRNDTTSSAIRAADRDNR